jgi:acyl carrier protein
MPRSWDERFEGVLRAVLPHADLAPDTCLRDVGLDSLATVDLLLRLEDTYGVSIPDEALTAEAFTSPARLWAMLDELAPSRVGG